MGTLTLADFREELTIDLENRSDGALTDARNVFSLERMHDAKVDDRNRVALFFGQRPEAARSGMRPTHEIRPGAARRDPGQTEHQPVVRDERDLSFHRSPAQSPDDIEAMRVDVTDADRLGACCAGFEVVGVIG